MLNAPEKSFRKALVVFLLGGMVPLAAHAQEVQKKWESYLSMGQSRATEAAVQQDIKTFFAHYEDDKPFSWEVKRQRVQAKKIVYDYRVKPERIVSTDWVHTYSDQEYADEDAVRAAILALRASDPQCPATTLVEDEWTEFPVSAKVMMEALPTPTRNSITRKTTTPLEPSNAVRWRAGSTFAATGVPYVRTDPP